MTTLSEIQAAVDDGRLVVKLPRRGWFLARWMKPELRGHQLADRWIVRVHVGPSNHTKTLSDVDSAFTWRIV